MKICTLMLVLVASSSAQTDKPSQHYVVFFVSAEEYKDESVEQRVAYLSGWLDGRLDAGSFGNAKR
jgi:hypothetical protein